MIHTARQTAKFIKLVRMIRQAFPGLPIDPDTVAVGILEKLWHFAINSAKRGDVGRHSDDVLAEAVGWYGEPAELVELLVVTGWLDIDPHHRLVVHDWDQHAPGFIKRNIAKSGGWAKSSLNDASVQSSDDLDDGSEDLDIPDTPLSEDLEHGSGHLTAQKPLQVPTPNLTKPNLTQPNPTGELRSWDGVELLLVEVGIGRREKVMAHLRSCGSEPFKVDQIVGVWRSHKGRFSNPHGALVERLMNEHPGMAADTGWVVPLQRDTGQRKPRDRTLDFEMQRTHLVKQLRSEGKDEEQIEAAVAKLAARLKEKANAT
jgi:hypothetical protein